MSSGGNGNASRNWAEAPNTDHPPHTQPGTQGTARFRIAPSILYAQKNAESAANAEGVQFPNGFAFDSVNHNIADVGLKVKQQTETLQFKNWFKNSKVVDRDPEPVHAVCAA